MTTSARKAGRTSGARVAPKGDVSDRDRAAECAERGLTPMREKFAQLVASGMKESDAYRGAYNAGKMKPKTINEAACRLAADSKIRARIAELRAPIVEKVRYELEDAMRECEEALEMAREARDSKSMKGLIELKAKLNGLMVEERQNKRTPLEDLSDAALDQQIARDAEHLGVHIGGGSVH